jgi:hypothetical protein
MVPRFCRLAVFFYLEQYTESRIIADISEAAKQLLVCWGRGGCINFQCGGATSNIEVA